jgi:Fur family transcriptional regulator, ferric uptake regulator
MTTPDVRAGLEAAGLKATRPRLLILGSLASEPAALTAQELHVKLRSQGRSPGLSTVYRTLHALAEAGVLDGFQKGTERAFRYCSDKHHHHIVCESCGAVEEVDAAEVERWVSRVARRRGFRVTGHEADIRGLCAQCS